MEIINKPDYDGMIYGLMGFWKWVKSEPDAGLEPAAVGLKVQRSTDWANQACPSHSAWTYIFLHHFLFSINYYDLLLYKFRTCIRSGGIFQFFESI